MNKVHFSPSGEHLAVCGSDGRLRIWDTQTNTLKQEFVPSAHLSSTCTCIEWAPSSTNQTQGTGKKKRKKKSIEGDVLALGTVSGSLIFYSVAKSQLLNHSDEAHTGSITGLTWSSTTLALFSCGEDGYIIEWDPEITSNISRWKGGKGLSAICVFNEFLLAAGHGITLWNLQTKTSIMTYLGHPSAVTQIETIPSTDYFVTMSNSERHLRIWSRSERNSVATLTVAERPQNFCVLSSSSNSKVSISVASRNGLLYIFEHKLNGALKKPLEPTSTVNIIDATDESHQVPIMASFLTDVSEHMSVGIAYGSLLRLRFEQFALKFLEEEVTIKREFLDKKKLTKNKSKTTLIIDSVEVPNDVKHLQPGSEVGIKFPDSKGKKRKKSNETDQKIDDGELPMEERLSNLTIETPLTGSIPDGSNLAHLLSQGLHSKDARIMHSVFSRWDEDVITNTVRSLPVQLVVPLLNEVKRMLTGKAMLNHSVIRWLKTIFQVHSAFLMSCPTSEDILGPFMSLLHSRETLYPRMCQLKGKLELIKGNIAAKEHRAEIPNEALLVYNDESSDEEGGEEDHLIASESEEFIGSDDLGVDEDDISEESGSDSDDENTDSGAASTESASDDDKSNTKHKSNTNKLKNHTVIVNGDDDEDSMDEDE